MVNLPVTQSVCLSDQKTKQNILQIAQQLCTYSNFLVFLFCIPYFCRYTMFIQTHVLTASQLKMPKMSISYKITAFPLLLATTLFSTFPTSPSLCGQPSSSKRQEYTGRKIILTSWFHVQFAQWYMTVGLKAKAREHSSNSLPATTNGIQ